MNDFEKFESNSEYSFSPDNFEPIMERMRGVSEFFFTHSVEDLIEKFKKFQRIDKDGNYVMSIKIIEKFSDYLVSETLNELVEKGLVDYYWSDEHQDFVFKTKEDK
jgi:hypothetical protein